MPEFDPHQHKRGAQKVCELAEIYTHALLCTEHRQKPNEVAKMAFEYAAATVELRNAIMRDADNRDQEAAAVADVDSSITLGEAQADTDARVEAGEAVSAPATEPAPPPVDEPAPPPPEVSPATDAEVTRIAAGD
jgi:hypothetical protein